MTEDIEFLKMLRVPPPNYCPTCRRMRRMINMNLSQLFKRPCDIPNHSESIISILPEECPFLVYEYNYFISDEFDAFSFCKKYDEIVNPKENLFNLRREFPMPSFLNRDTKSTNSDYSNGGRNMKNAYYTMGCFNSENVWYSNLIYKSKDIMDSRFVNNSDHVYSSNSSDHIYKCSFVYFSRDCANSMFLFDCRDSDNCFGCVNLRGAKYCVWNVQLSKTEYEDFIKSIYPLTRETLLEYQNRLLAMVKSLPLNASRNISTENVMGVLCENTRNAYDVTDTINSEHIRHLDGCLSHQDSMDVLFSGGNSSMLYDCTNVGSQANNIKFSVSSKFSTESEFIFNCGNVHNCFMCFGIRNKSYCILNVQYSPEEYFVLLDKIKSKMLENGEYGEGLDMKFSAQAYNFSIGQLFFPLTDSEIIKLGGYVAKEPETNYGEIKIISTQELPQ